MAQEEKGDFYRMIEEIENWSNIHQGEVEAKVKAAQERWKKQEKKSRGWDTRDTDFSAKPEFVKQALDSLGLIEGCTVKDAKKARKEMAEKYHPDLLPPDATPEQRRIATEKMKEINAAYDKLIQSMNC